MSVINSSSLIPNSRGFSNFCRARRQSRSFSQQLVQVFLNFGLLKLVRIYDVTVNKQKFGSRHQLPDFGVDFFQSTRKMTLHAFDQSRRFTAQVFGR